MFDIPKNETRALFLHKNINNDTVNDVIKEIIKINEKDDALEHALHINYAFNLPKRPPIKLYIDSYGGSVTAALGLIGVIQTSKTPVHTIVTGMAASAAFMIYIAGKERHLYKYATLMYHQISKFQYGELKVLEDEIEEVRRLQKIVEHLVLYCTSITKERLQEVYEKKIDWYITPSQALGLGLVEMII